MNNKSKFQTLIIIDLETTGLICDKPKITELAMIGVNIATLDDMKKDEELPRVLNKFVKFFNPVKLLGADVAEMTGLNNRILMDYAPFNRETVLAIEAFLSDFQKPICFIAHNGNLFDFPILFAEIQSALSNPSFYTNATINNHIYETNTTMSNDEISVDCLSTKETSIQTITTNNDYSSTSLLSIDCADSLVFFRYMYRLLNDKHVYQDSIEHNLSEFLVRSNRIECQNNASGDSIQLNSSSHGETPIKYIPSSDPMRQTPSMKLGKIYEREFNKQISHLKSHHAEDDCLMLLAILKRYLPDWLEWIEVNHQPLSNFSLP